VPALEEVPGIADVQFSGGQELPAEPAPTQEPARAAANARADANPAPTSAPAGGGSKLPLMWQLREAQGINLAVAAM